MQIGSKAFERYTGQGYSLVGGSGRNLSRSETRSIFQGISEPSPELKALSIAMATGQPIPEGVTDNEGNSAAGRVYSSDGSFRMASELQAAQETAAAAEQTAINTRAQAATTETLVGGGNAQGATDNPFKVPTFDNQRFGLNSAFFNMAMEPGGTANTTPMFAENKQPGGFQGFNAGGGAGGGGGGSWGGGGGFTWGDGSGQYTPGVTGDGFLTATRNQGVPSQPTNKEQANQAGVPDTGGQRAANQTAANPNEGLLRKTMIQLVEALTAQRDLLQNQLTGTAEPVDNAIANVDNALTTAYEAALADLPDYEKMKQDAKDLYELKADLIEDRRDTLEDRYREDRAAIEADAEIQKDELQQSQRGQTGRLAGGLASAGAYLGFDNVNHSAMLSLQVTHDREMTVLGQAKLAALSEARRAFEDSDFALLTEHINAIEAYDKKITDLANTHFTQTLQLTQEARNNVKFMQDTETFERTRTMTNLDTIITSGEPVSQQDVQNYARQLKLSPEQVQGYITSKRNTIDLEENRQKTADQIQLLNLLRGIDKGTFVTIDGQTYEGLQRVPVSGQGSSSDRVLTWEDWNTKLNRNPIAKQFVGNMTYNQAIQYMAQDQPPEEVAEWLSSAEGISENPDVAAGQIQEGWVNLRNDVLGLTSSRDFGQFTPGEQKAIVAEINRQLTEEAQARGQQFTDPVGMSDLENVNKYPYEVLSTYLEESKMRNDDDSGSDSQLLNWLQGTNQQTLAGGM